MICANVPCTEAKFSVGEIFFTSLWEFLKVSGTYSICMPPDLSSLPCLPILQFPLITPHYNFLMQVIVSYQSTGKKIVI